MRILLLGDASSFHASLASALGRLGHDVTLASDGCKWMHTRRDLDIGRGPGKISGAWLWLKLNTLMAGRLKGYDVVQLCSPFFINLRPGRLLSIFRRLKRDNGRIFLTDLGNTPDYVRFCLNPSSPLRYSEWRNPSIPRPESNPAALTWLSPELDAYCKEIYDGVDGVVTALYEYHLAAATHVDPRKLHYLGIPVDLATLPEPDLHAPSGPVRILSAYDASRAENKGARILHDMAARLVARHPGRAELKTVCNVPYTQFISELQSSDIVLDQLYSYTPATTALLAMASGGVSVSGAEEEFYSFISESRLRPIINADPYDLEATASGIERLILDPDLLAARKEQGREFVETHHSSDYLALRSLDLWTS